VPAYLHGTMTNAPATSPPTRDAAFVVHLATDAGEVHGRVEHVTTGRASRFRSVAELLDFMRQTLVAIQADREPTREER
jgi:hypothetical protein